LLPFPVIIEMQGPTGADFVEPERDLIDCLFSSVEVVLKSGAEGRSRKRHCERWYER
jgi:hypothetical protein